MEYFDKVTNPLQTSNLIKTAAEILFFLQSTVATKVQTRSNRIPSTKNDTFMPTCADYCPLCTLGKKSPIYSNFYRRSAGKKKARNITFQNSIFQVWNLRINRKSFWSYKCQSSHHSQERQQHTRTRALHAWIFWKHSGDSPLHLSFCGYKPSSVPRLYRLCTPAVSRLSTVHLLWTDINAFPNADKWSSTWESRNSYRQLMY